MVREQQQTWVIILSFPSLSLPSFHLEINPEELAKGSEAEQRDLEFGL